MRLHGMDNMLSAIVCLTSVHQDTEDNHVAMLANVHNDTQAECVTKVMLVPRSLCLGVQLKN